MVSVVGALGSSTGAQPVPPVIEAVSVLTALPDDDGPTPVAVFHGGAVMSDAGTIVAFDAADEQDRSDRRVWIRDRSAGTTLAVSEERSAAPGISADGCLVAYSVAGGDDADPTVSLTVVDRCRPLAGDALPAGTVLDTIEAGDVVAPPALSSDGSTIVWSTGTEIRRYVRPTVTEPHVAVGSFDSDVTPSAGVMTGADVDVSGDGSTVAYVAGAGSAPFVPDVGNVYVWSSTDGVAPTVELLSPTALGDPGSLDSGSPTLSSDGSLLVFDSTSTDLAAVAGNPITVPFLVHVDRTELETRVLHEDAARPTLSADGLHVGYRRGDAVRVLSSTDRAFATTTDRAVAGFEDADPSGRMAVSRFGRWIVADSADGASITDEPELQAGVMVWAVDLRASTDGSVDDTTTTTTTAPPTTTDPVTTTTVPGGVAPPTTVPRATTRPPVIRIPRVPRRVVPPRRTNTGISSFVASVVAEPSLVTFEPTTVIAGRRTATVSLTNVGDDTATLLAARIEPADASPFSIVADSCAGVALFGGAGCSVDVAFAPATEGSLGGSLVFDLDDGAVVTVALSGDGIAAPTLTPVPAVATAGQVVTVFGDGFPAGVPVALRRSGTSEVEQVTVDADGTFAHVFVVMPRTPPGPMMLSVAGQVDQFADVSAELLVSRGGGGSNAAAFRDGVGNPFGR